MDVAAADGALRDEKAVDPQREHVVTPGLAVVLDVGHERPPAHIGAREPGRPPVGGDAKALDQVRLEADSTWIELEPAGQRARVPADRHRGLLARGGRQPGAYAARRVEDLE